MRDGRTATTLTAAEKHDEWRKLIAARVAVTLVPFAPKKPQVKE